MFYISFFLVNLSIKSTHQEGNLSIHQEGNLPEGVLSNILSNLIMNFFFQKVKRKVSFIEDRSYMYFLHFIAEK